MRRQLPPWAKTRTFTASEVAEFEYCQLAWWHEQFEPWVQAENDELFARLVELEHEHSAQAPGLPEYRLIEGLLLRHGAFAEGRRQHQEHAEAVEDIEEEIAMEIRPGAQEHGRVLLITTLVLSTLALVLLGLALLAH
ncbi:MAG TPA: hypothetical protein VGF67_17005 [Ktedonobacteraceae bacterium]|jgi:hypothetical protein